MNQIFFTLKFMKLFYQGNTYCFKTMNEKEIIEMIQEENQSLKI